MQNCLFDLVLGHYVAFRIGLPNFIFRINQIIAISLLYLKRFSFYQNGEGNGIDFTWGAICTKLK